MKIFNNFFKLKFLVKHYQTDIKNIVQEKYNYRRILTILENQDSPFNKHRINSLRNFINVLDEELKILIQERKILQKELFGMIIDFDNYYHLTEHEQSQILGIHHVHVSNIKKRHNISTLLEMIALHVELCGEGWYNARSTTLFDCYVSVSSEFFMNNKNFQEEAMNKIKEMIGESSLHNDKDDVKSVPTLKIVK